LIEHLHGREQVQRLIVWGARVPRVARESALADRHVKRHGAAALAIEPPGFTLGGYEQPSLPFPCTIRLITEELHPGKGARVLDDLRGRCDLGRDLSLQLGVEAEEQFGLVALWWPACAGHRARQAADEHVRARKLLARSCGSSA
jgi:hypothetical protein